MDRIATPTTTPDTRRAIAHHTAAATLALATAAGHLGKLRELAPEQDADYRDLLDRLGALSVTARRTALATEATA